MNIQLHMATRDLSQMRQGVWAKKKRKQRKKEKLFISINIVVAKSIKKIIIAFSCKVFIKSKRPAEQK